MKAIRIAPSRTVLVHIAVVIAGYFMPHDARLIAAINEAAPPYSATQAA